MKGGDSFDVSGIDSPTAPDGGIMTYWNEMPLIHRSFTVDFTDAIPHKYTQFSVLRLDPFQNGFGVKRNVSHIHIEFGYHGFH